MNSRAGFRRVRFADRLLAEAVAAGERHEGRAARDADAEAAALEVPADFEKRVVARAQALPNADDLRDATRRVQAVVTIVIAVALVLGALAGAAAGRAALATPREPVNFFLILLGLLGVQAVLLVAWFILFLFGQRLLRRGSLGGLLLRVSQAAARRFLPRKDHLAALEAFGRLTMRGRSGAWTISSVSHQMWAMFNVGCLLMVVVLLSTNQYNFVWETTTRTEQQYVALTQAIAQWPDRFGFATPNEAQIRASRLIEEEAGVANEDESRAAAPIAPLVDDRERQLAWSGLLIGCLVTYGLLPRLLLSIVCVIGGWIARRRLRLDLGAPEYAVLRPFLVPASQHHINTPHAAPIVDDESSIASPGGGTDDQRPIGPAAIIGLEIDRPACAWPPAVHGLNWDDHGFVDSGADRKRLVEALRMSHTRPATLAVVCELPATPDRGAGAFLHELREAAGAPVTAILTGGQRLRDRGNGDALKLRVEDWTALLTAAGVAPDRIIQVDFDHLTDRSSAALRNAVLDQRRVSFPSAVSKLRESFHRIEAHAGQWRGDPAHADVLKLHQEIASLYRQSSAISFSSTTSGLGRIAREVASGGRNVQETVQNGVKSVLNQLPSRLRAQPKWIAAGAAAGAFGCLALTLSIAPAAIGALPAWAALGAAIGAGARAALPERDDVAKDVEKGITIRASAIRAAALFAVLLDLQGRPETEISRIIDATFTEQSEAETSALDTDENVRAWLLHVAERYDRAAALGGWT